MTSRVRSHLRWLRAGRAQAEAQEEVIRAQREQLEQQAADLRRAHERLSAVEDGVAAARNKLAHLEPDDIGRAQAVAEDAVAGAGNARELADGALQRAGAAQARAEDADARASLALDTARESLLGLRVAAFSAWLELCPPAGGPLVSVVLPTHDRPALLPRAVASVLEQEYQLWELVVVDDGDTDAVDEVLADVDAPAITVVEGPRRGLGAARNAGLDAASGEVACYLDDDNVMHPLWLSAVAHVFATRDDVDVAYGVAVAEHRVPGSVERGDWWPSLWQMPWSRATLLEQNVTDAGALAHRRTLEDARFDEELASGEDWDLLLRLTADRDALAMPAISHAYAMSSDDRMSRAPSHASVLDEIRRRHSEK